MEFASVDPGGMDDVTSKIEKIDETDACARNRATDICYTREGDFGSRRIAKEARDKGTR
jgi:hypothetical protein